MRAAAVARAAGTPSPTGTTTSRYALSLGSVPDGRTTTRVVPVRRTSTSDSGSRSSTGASGSASSVTGGPARSRRMIPSISRRSVTRTETWSVAYTPNSAASSSSRSASVRPCARSPAASSPTSSAALIPSLSRTSHGAAQ
jgi:hypothetical protein